MPAYNEMLNNNDSVRRPYGKVAKWIDSMHGNIFEEKHNEAKDLQLVHIYLKELMDLADI